MLNKKSLNLIIKIVGIIGIFSIGLIVGLFILNDTQTHNNYGNNKDPIADNDLIFLAPPITSSFLDEEGGITLYFNAGQTLDLSIAKSEFKTIEEETADYVIGSLSLPSLPETEDVHCLVHHNGWIICFYLKQEPVSKIVDWNEYSGGVLSKTKLYEGLEIIANAYPSVIITSPHYYHYNYQTANKLMIIIEEATNDEDDTFNLQLPSEFTFYEESWALHGAEHSYAEEYLYGELSPKLTLDVTHIIELYHYSKYISFTYYWYYGFRIDGGALIAEVGEDAGTGRVALALTYYQP